MMKDIDNNLHITNDELMVLRENSPVNIIDVRELFEYKICHIPESKLIPLNTLLSRYPEILDKESTYYILCHTGQRSYYVTDYLTKNGYNAVNILGGIVENNTYNVPY